MLIEIMNNSVRFEKEYAYKVMLYLVKKNPDQIKICMPTLVPLLASDVNDVNVNVKNVASEVLELVLHCSGNADLNTFIPIVLKGLKDPSIIYDAVESLASCVFVQNRCFIII